MPKVPTDYTKTIIYKLVHKEDFDNANIYIGSTTNFTKRKSQHKFSCLNEKSKEYHQNKYQSIRDNGSWNQWNMIEIEKYPCNDKREAEAKEEYWRIHFNAILNSKACSSLTDNKTEYGKKYRETNKKEIAENGKIYRQDNKEEIAEYRKIYRETNKKKIAENGKKYNEVNKEKKAKYRQDNKEKIAENNKKYRENNKEKIAKNEKIYNEVNKEKKTKYRQDNKEKIAENKKKYDETNKEKIAEYGKKYRESKKAQNNQTV